MNEAYLDLKKKIDTLRDMPDAVETSNIFEFNMNDMATRMLAVNNPTVDNLYNYVDNEISPEFEKIAAIASVDVSGGREGYVSVELIPEKLKQYHLTSQNVADAVANSCLLYTSYITGLFEGRCHRRDYVHSDRVLLLQRGGAG